jgi:hypothetical protein
LDVVRCVLPKTARNLEGGAGAGVMKAIISRSKRSAFCSAIVMSPESLDSTSAAPQRSADGVGDR